MEGRLVPLVYKFAWSAHRLALWLVGMMLHRGGAGPREVARLLWHAQHSEGSSIPIARRAEQVTTIGSGVDLGRLELRPSLP
eukprot:182877-Chlamydomonas_euryale.AAC.2